jgi:hypothetical protein
MTARTSALSPHQSVSAFTPVRSGLLQRKCACGGASGPSGECEECKKKRLQRKASRLSTLNSQHSEVPPIVHEVLHSPGQPLDPATRRIMEPHFAYDFSQVRIHDGEQAAASASAVEALAYTVGRNVVFGSGQYRPATVEGRRLIAHELAHVIQQEVATHVTGPLQLGDANDRLEQEADRAFRRKLAPAQWTSTRLTVQRDLARPPRGPTAPLVALTAEQIDEAINFNENRFSDPYSIAVIRDVVGISRFPAIVDEELVQAIVQWQAERRETQDGKIGHITTRSFVLELIAEGQHRDAVVLIVDSYGLLTSLRLNDIRVGTGPDCCGTAAAPADAVTFGGVCPPVGAPVRICVCRTSFPPATDYNHFVRIVGHEMIHVPHCAGAALNLPLTEFEAFFFEACGEGRAARLTAAQRVNHANIALAHFAALPAADQTPARIAMRDRLNRLVAAGGVGPCI